MQGENGITKQAKEQHEYDNGLPVFFHKHHNSFDLKAEKRAAKRRERLKTKILSYIKYPIEVYLKLPFPFCSGKGRKINLL